MKVIILLVYIEVSSAYNGISQGSGPKNMFEPAQSYHSRLAMTEGTDPMRDNQGVFFLPATLLPRFESGFDHLHEQVLNSQREKRDAAGALHIVTNHALPIHADVKPHGTVSGVSEKPCPISKNSPSHVENGVVFQVTAPKDTSTFYELKSLRKSWPLPSKLELVRSVSRFVTLAVLLVSAVVEFFPLLKKLCIAVYNFLNL